MSTRKPHNVGARLVVALTGGLLGGCTTIHQPVSASVPLTPAIAEPGRKGTGDVKIEATDGFVVVSAGAHKGTLAQSDAGALGDRLFRENAYGFVEGCRYLPRGRVCELVTTPEGTFLASGLSWVVPRRAPVTPGTGGWALQGRWPVTASQGRQAHLARKGSSDVGHEEQPHEDLVGVVFFGRALHCRFSDAGPVCVGVPATKQEDAYGVLGAFSLQEGARRSDVIWLEVFESSGPSASGARSGAEWFTGAKRPTRRPSCVAARR